MSTMHRVREHLAAEAAAHRKIHEDRLREAMIARIDREAADMPSVPQAGLQPLPGVVLDVGGE